MLYLPLLLELSVESITHLRDSLHARRRGRGWAEQMVRPICRALHSAARIGAHHAGLLRPSANRALSGAASSAVPGAAQNLYIEPHHDRDLRQIFDSKHFWDEFSRHGISDPTSRKGLFQNDYLTNPRGFLRFAADTQARCRSLVDGILQSSTLEEFKALPRQFDRLSDALCQVLDAADFVRCVHPNPHFQDGAAKAYAQLWEYMNVLNTTPGLNSQLGLAIQNPEVSSAWTEEESTVAKILSRDFSVSAIDLPEQKREQFVDLSNNVKSLGHTFVERMGPTQQYIEVESSDLKGLDPAIISRYKIGRGKIAFPTVGEDAHIALCSVHSERVRSQIYVAGRQAPKQQLGVLEALLRTRAQIATLSGFKSYSEMTLADKMAGSPEAVDSFLKALSADNGHYVKGELESLQALRRSSDQWQLQGSDILYYQSLSNSQSRFKSRNADFMDAYFSLGTVMQGLSRLFERLYGVRFVPRPISAGEAWDPGVRRLDVVHETEGHVAVLYCDLFARDGKAPNPAHYTLRCSRQIWLDEISEVPRKVDQVKDGVNVIQSGKLFQVPTIALVCDFAHPRDSTSPTLLGFREYTTLFHEMGHAIHSILGRTSMQVVSGTRCATDFSELPSVLMESFASDPSVLSLFARHWETDEGLPYQMVEEALSAQKRWQGIQTETQLLNSLLDQAYHSSLGHEMTGWTHSTKVFHDISDTYAHIREPPITTPQAFFGHLVEYGGLYYSYLFDRAIAGKIWREVFSAGRGSGAIDRAAGERYKDEVLRWGGARSGWACLSGVLGDESLRDGGRRAMEEVGQWGVHD